MAGASWSSSSSCTSSLGSLDDDVVCVIKPGAVGAPAAAGEGSVVKFLCSYGGRIQPRPTDGALRYVGGDNRVLSVHRSLQFHELQRKLSELCGREACLRCELPMAEGLDALISVTSDDDLANLLEEYDAAGKGRRQPLKIRAFLFPRAAPPEPSSVPRSTPPPLPRPSSSNAARLNVSPVAAAARVSPPTCALIRWWDWEAPLAPRPARENVQPHRYGQRATRPHRYLVHSGSHWQ